MNKIKTIPYLVPTDKPSTIFLTKGKLEFSKSFTEHGQANLSKMHLSNDIIPQHLYLTIDEEIKDWMLHPEHGKVIDFRTMPKSTSELAYRKNGWKKIVASTDPALTEK